MVRTKGAIRALWLLVVAVGFTPAALSQAKGKRKPPPVFNSPIPAPVLAPAEATEQYGDWRVMRLEPSSFMASTVNESGSAFGVICDKSCTAFFNPSIDCKDGAKFPALINTPDGAYSVMLDCVRGKDLAVYTMTFTKGIYSSMETGGELGIAFPLASGQFKVTRFSLTGSMRAATRAYNLSAASATAPSGSGLKDQTL